MFTLYHVWCDRSVCNVETYLQWTSVRSNAFSEVIFNPFVWPIVKKFHLFFGGKKRSAQNIMDGGGAAKRKAEEPETPKVCMGTWLLDLKGGEGLGGWERKVEIYLYIYILPCVASLLYKLLKLSMFSCPLLLAHASGPPGHVYYPMVGTIRTVCRDRSSPFERCTSNNRFPSIFNSSSLPRSGTAKVQSVHPLPAARIHPTDSRRRMAACLCIVHRVVCSS